MLHADDRRRLTKGFVVVGQNPVVGSANSGAACARRCATSTGSSCATSSRSRRRRSGATAPSTRPASTRRRTSAPRSSSCPPRRTPRRTGTFTNTQRLLQWHHKAVEPPRGLPLGAVVRLPPRRAGPREARGLDRGATGRCARSTWDYPLQGPHDEPDAEAVLQEINGRTRRRLVRRRSTRSSRTTARRRAARGCTPASTPAASTRRARRKPGTRAELDRARVGLGVAGEPAHPLQPRLGRPGRHAVVRAQALRLVGRRRRAAGRRSATTPTSRPTRRRTTCPARTTRPGWTRCAGRRRSSRTPTGSAGCTRRPASSTGRCPRTTSRTSRRSPTPLYAVRRATRRGRRFDDPDNPYNPSARREVFPFVMTTYRLTEHHTAGGMSRTVAHLVRAAAGAVLRGQPGARRASAGSSTRGWATIVTARTAIEARVLVTDRVRPLTVGGRVVAPGRPALPLGPPRPGHRRRGQRAAADGARPQHAHHASTRR